MNNMRSKKKLWKCALSGETRYTVRNLYVLLALEVLDFFLYEGRSLTSAYSSCRGGGCHSTPNCVSWMMRSISKIYKTDSQCTKGQLFLNAKTVTLFKRSAICWWANFHSPLYVFSWISTNRSAFFSCRSTSCFSFSFPSRSKGTFDLNSVSVSLRIFRLVDKTSCNLIGRKNNKYGKLLKYNAYKFITCWFFSSEPLSLARSLLPVFSTPDSCNSVFLHSPYIASWSNRILFAYSTKYDEADRHYVM